MKFCSRCKIKKEDSDFNWRNKARGWLKSECRTCQASDMARAKAKDQEAFNAKVNARKRAWRARNPDAGKAHYAKNREKEAARRAAYLSVPENRARTNAQNRESRLRNPEKHQECVRNWSKRNPDKLRQYQDKYYQANRQVVFERSRRRRATKLERMVVPFSKSDLDARMEAQGNCCVYCGGPFQEIDHAIPLSRGGKHCLANLRPSCRSCNRRKWARKPSEWSLRV